MGKESYIHILIESLEKKSQVLDDIAKCDAEQKAIISAEEPDLKQLENNIDKVGMLAERVEKLNEGFETVYEKVRQELQDNKTEHRAEIKRMQELIREIELLQSKREADTAEQPKTTEALDENEKLFLMRVIEAVNAAMPHGNFGVEQIAAELNMSVQTFRRKVQSAAGESPKAYIQAIQMEKAIVLLKNKPDISVAQVANLCGFDETSSFGHTFKRIYGCSPSEYRDKQ